MEKYFLVMKTTVAIFKINQRNCTIKLHAYFNAQPLAFIREGILSEYFITQQKQIKVKIKVSKLFLQVLCGQFYTRICMLICIWPLIFISFPVHLATDSLQQLNHAIVGDSNLNPSFHLLKREVILVHGFKIYTEPYQDYN